jgi:hypothetical protein
MDSVKKAQKDPGTQTLVECLKRVVYLERPILQHDLPVDPDLPLPAVIGYAAFILLPPGEQVVRGLERIGGLQTDPAQGAEFDEVVLLGLNVLLEAMRLAEFRRREPLIGPGEITGLEHFDIGLDQSFHDVGIGFRAHAPLNIDAAGGHRQDDNQE